MNNLIANVIAKAIKPTAPMGAGEYQVDEVVTLHLKGTLKQSEDHSYTPTVDIPMLATMALLLEKMGVVGPHAEAMLVSAMSEAINANESASLAIEARVRDIERASARVREMVGQLPRKTRRGPSRWDGSAELAEVAVAA